MKSIKVGQRVEIIKAFTVYKKSDELKECCDVCLGQTIGKEPPFDIPVGKIKFPMGKQTGRLCEAHFREHVRVLDQ